MDGGVTIRAKTKVGHITPTTEVPQQLVGAVCFDTTQLAELRSEVRGALNAALGYTTSSKDQCLQVLGLCATYQSAFSLSADEFGKMHNRPSGVFETGTKTVDETPYRTNPRLNP